MQGFYDLGPESLNEMFQPHIPERTHRLEDKLNVKLPRCTTSFGQKNLVVRGSGYWNSLPGEIKSKTTSETFKQTIKN